MADAVTEDSSRPQSAGPDNSWQDRGDQHNGNPGPMDEYGRRTYQDGTPAPHDDPDLWWRDWERVSKDLAFAQDLALRERSRGTPLVTSSRAYIRLLHNIHSLLLRLAEPSKHSNDGMQAALESVQDDHLRMCEFSGDFADLFNPTLGRIIIDVCRAAYRCLEINPPSRLPEEERRTLLLNALIAVGGLPGSGDDHTYLISLKQQFRRASKVWAVAKDDRHVESPPEASEFLNLIQDISKAEELRALPASLHNVDTRNIQRRSLRQLLFSVLYGEDDCYEKHIPRLKNLIDSLLNTDMAAKGLPTNGADDVGYLVRLDREIANYGDGG